MFVMFVGHVSMFVIGGYCAFKTLTFNLPIVLVEDLESFLLLVEVVDVVVDT